MFFFFTNSTIQLGHSCMMWGGSRSESENDRSSSQKSVTAKYQETRQGMGARFFFYFLMVSSKILWQKQRRYKKKRHYRRIIRQNKEERKSQLLRKDHPSSHLALGECSSIGLTGEKSKIYFQRIAQMINFIQEKLNNASVEASPRDPIKQGFKTQTWDATCLH